MNPEMRAGQLWEVQGSTDLALVVFTWSDDLFGEDVRVLPVFRGPAHAALASDRDVIIRSASNTLGIDLLVNCWNGQALSHEDLAELVGEVTPEALEAARGVEMTGLVPDEAGRFALWVGPKILEDSDARMNARRAFFQTWEDIRARLALFRKAFQITYSGSGMAAGYLFKGLNGVTSELMTFTLSGLELAPFSAPTEEAGSVADGDSLPRAA